MSKKRTVWQLSPQMTLEIKGARIQTLPSTDEGIAFLISYQGHVIYHAGDLNWWHWEGRPEEYDGKLKDVSECSVTASRYQDRRGVCSGRFTFGKTVCVGIGLFYAPHRYQLCISYAFLGGL